MPIQLTKYSRKDFDETICINDTNVSELKSEYFLCINASGGMHSEPYFSLPHTNVLNVYFDDVIADTVKYYGPTDSEFAFNAKACTIIQAKEMLEFIKKIPNDSKLHVYCTKGKSRSVSIVKFINEHINMIKDDSEGYNILIYELLVCLNSK